MPKIVTLLLLIGLALPAWAGRPYRSMLLYLDTDGHRYDHLGQVAAPLGEELTAAKLPRIELLVQNYFTRSSLPVIVTTREPHRRDFQAGVAQRVVITPTPAWQLKPTVSGFGFAYSGTWYGREWPDVPCYACYADVQSAELLAIVAAHEAGHTAGLDHTNHGEQWAIMYWPIQTDRAAFYHFDTINSEQLRAIFSTRLTRQGRR